jgi:periplasmic divalent cation tolerance protein
MPPGALLYRAERPDVSRVRTGAGRNNPATVGRDVLVRNILWVSKDIGGVMAKRIDAIVVLVSCKSVAQAWRIARTVVKDRLAACGNVVGPRVTSVYRWKAKVEEANEALLFLKSTRGKFSALEREIRTMHSYKNPEIIALPVVLGSADYLSWIEESVTAKKKTPRR